MHTTLHNTTSSVLATSCRNSVVGTQKVYHWFPFVWSHRGWAMERSLQHTFFWSKREMKLPASMWGFAALVTKSYLQLYVHKWYSKRQCYKHWWGRKKKKKEINILIRARGTHRILCIGLQKQWSCQNSNSWSMEMKYLIKAWWGKEWGWARQKSSPMHSKEQLFVSAKQEDHIHLQDETLKVSSTCTQLRSKNLFCLQNTFHKVSKSWVQRKRTLEQQPNTNVCLSTGILLLQVTWEPYHDTPHTKSDNTGKTLNASKDLSTSSLLFLRSFSSLDIRNFGIQVLYLSSFSLRGGRGKSHTNWGFAAGHVPSSNPSWYKATIFPSLPPPTAPTQMQACAALCTSTRCRCDHLAARHQDMLFLLKVIFLTRSLPGPRWLSALGAGLFLP